MIQVNLRKKIKLMNRVKNTCFLYKKQIKKIKKLITNKFIVKI